MDRAVLLVLLTRAVALVAAPVTLWLIATRRPLLEQGPYFVFWNTQALVQLMELGVGTLIVQFASHESRRIAWDARGGLAGDLVVKARILRLVREGQRWYSVISLGLLVVAGFGGSFLLQSRASGLQPSPLVPWLLTVVFTAAYLPLVPVLCTIEGCGGLLPVQRMRLTQVTVATAALWSVMLTKGALWAVGAFAVVWWAVACVWLAVFHRGFLSELRSSDTELRYGGAASGDGALLAAQWRTGVSWMAWWVATQALTPIVLASHGPSVAGQVGMTLAIAMAPLTLAGAWLQGRYPRYGALVASGGEHELRRLAVVATAQALIVCTVGTLAATAVVAGIARLAPDVAIRALPAGAIAVLGAANLGWLSTQSLASYLRAWREEPLMEATLIGAGLVILGTALVSASTSARNTVTAYALLVTFGVLPIALFEFRRRHRPRRQRASH